MTDSEKKVTYRAVGNFTSFNRAVNNARKNIDRLKKSQAELNASSAATAASLGAEGAALDKASTSIGKHAKAVDSNVVSTGKHAAALSEESAAAERVAASWVVEPLPRLVFVLSTRLRRQQ